jgi:hypothetical protein
MPKFKKSTGYKMKGSTFYGHGNSSPAKVSDSEVREAVAALDKTQMRFRMPGWAKAAGEAWKGVQGVLDPGGLLGKKKKKTKDEKVPKVKTDHELDAPETPKNQNPLDDPNQGDVWA